MPPLLIRLIAACLLASALAAPVQAAAEPASAPVAVASAPAASLPAASAPALAPPAEGAASAPMPSASLDTRVQELKADVIRLNRDLFVLEEELLYPPGTQVALFVSLDVGKLFELESVRVLLDDKVVASHLYTPLELQALQRGAVQRVFMGNLRTGKHAISAFFTGRGPHERDYKRGTTLEFDKGAEPRYIELRIRDAQAKLQPEFEVKVWQ